MFVGKWIKKVSRPIYTAFIGILFLFFLIHLVNFAIIRLMDTSIMLAIDLFFGTNLKQIFVTLRAINLNMFTKIIAIFAFLSLPFLGILLYRSTKKLSEKLPIAIRKRELFFIAIIAFSSLILIDIAIDLFVPNYSFASDQKKLPLGTTILSQTAHIHSLSSHLKIPKKESEVLKNLEQSIITPAKKPNIFLFVIESFRHDAVQPKIVPNLFQLKKSHISPLKSLSNANATHISWFCIFHSIFPHYWSSYMHDWNSGSAGLRLLKKWGYKTHIFSSAELSHFNSNTTLFGTDNELADVLVEFSETKPHKRDKMAFQALKKTIKNHPSEGNVFCLFLDSPHSEYSYPKHFPAPFSPAAKNINYLRFIITKNGIEKIKNRYFNSLHYLDSLFGDFFSFLQEKDLYKEAIIVVTGDHGEEFFEQGSLFHITHLNSYQTEVPIIFKIPNRDSSYIPIASHIDIFPTIIHSLTGKEDFCSLFDGTSIFSSKHSPYVMSVAQNGQNIPLLFSLHDGDHRFIGQFQGGEHFETIRNVQVLSVNDSQDRAIIDEPRQNQLENHFFQALEQMFLEVR